MAENERLTDRQARRAKLKEVAAATDGTVTKNPNWVMRVRVVGDRLKVRLVPAEKTRE